MFFDGINLLTNKKRMFYKEHPPLKQLKVLITTNKLYLYQLL